MVTLIMKDHKHGNKDKNNNQNNRKKPSQNNNSDSETATKVTSKIQTARTCERLILKWKQYLR